MEKRLYRIKKGRMLSGVAGGLGEYFDIDPTVIRLIFVAITIAFFPFGIVSYIVAAVIIPEKEKNHVKDAAVGSDGRGREQGNGPITPGQGQEQGDGSAMSGQRQDRRNGSATPEQGQEQRGKPITFQGETDRTRFLIGAVLLFIGACLLSKQLFPWFFMKYFWPVLLIVIGAFIIVKGRRR